jgi:oxazoline/thiazoline synthase
LLPPGVVNTNFHATHNFSVAPRTVNELRQDWAAETSARASTAEQGEVSVLKKAIERFSGFFQSDEIRVTRRLSEFVSGETFLLTKSCCSARRNTSLVGADARLKRFGGVGPLDRSAEIKWSPIWSLRDQRFKHFPTSLLYLNAVGASAVPLILLTIAGRFGRISWVDSSLTLC